jgi:hypothetical protein
MIFMGVLLWVTHIKTYLGASGGMVRRACHLEIL